VLAEQRHELVGCGDERDEIDECEGALEDESRGPVTGKPVRHSRIGQK